MLRNEPNSLLRCNIFHDIEVMLGMDIQKLDGLCHIEFAKIGMVERIFRIQTVEFL